MIALARLAAAGLAAAAALSLAPRPADTAAPDDYPAGAALFARHCAACHTLGGGAAMGPDLQGVTLRRSNAWLLAWIDDPAAVVRSDSTAARLVNQWGGWVMPGIELTGPQILDIVDFLTAADAGEVGDEGLARVEAARSAAPAAHCGRGPGHRGGMAGGGACPMCAGGGQGHAGHRHGGHGRVAPGGGLR